MNNPGEWKIVLMDDEADIREVVSIVLSDAGFRVKTAENGEAGIKLCEAWSPQIVVTDIRMPGMDGIAVLEHLKKNSPDIEVIVITAFGELDLAISALKLDASDFITKPVSDKALNLALTRAMDRYSSRKKLREYAFFLEQENISQAKLMHKEKLISLGHLCASVVHEINNPMAGILNYARLMIKMLKTGEFDENRMVKFMAYLELVESEAARVAKIASSLLTFSRKSDFSITDIVMDDLVERAVVLSRHRLELSNIVLSVSVEKNIPLFKGDFNKLQQSIINLIFNGIDAMPHGGELSISAFYDREHGYATIRVKDTGTGINPCDLKQIQEPFFTTKDEGYGVGLGLSIVFGIMERHSGYVDVESTPGVGTCFTLRIPA